MTELSAYGTCTLDDPASASRKAGEANAGGCTTCGDLAVPIRVVCLLGGGLALCADRTGGTAEMAVAFTPEAAPGDVLLVHLGVAIARPEAAPS